MDGGGPALLAERRRRTPLTMWDFAREKFLYVYKRLAGAFNHPVAQ